VRLTLEALEDRAVPAVLTVNTLSDQTDHTDSVLTLREAIAVVNSQSDADLNDAEKAQISGTLGTDTIQFAPSLFSGGAGTITLGGSELLITDTTGLLTIRGPGADLLSISGNHAVRVFHFDAISTGVTASISGLTIANGKALDLDPGAGILNTEGTLTVSNCAVTGNFAERAGAGIANKKGTVIIRNSTIADNTTTGGAGGVYSINGVTNLTNCTISGNSADHAAGIECDVDSAMTVKNCTISNNTAGREAGGIQVVHGDFILLNTVVAGNFVGSSESDISGTAQANYSLIKDTSGWTAATGSGNNITDVDPLLAPLGNYGGPTQTMALLPGSPAIDAGRDGTDVPSADQRGQSRVSAVDIGAFESQGFTMSLVSGDNQVAETNSAFGDPLVVEVKANQSLEPVAGGVVTFTAPASGASTSPAVTQATIDSSGMASDAVSANGTAGSYQVVAGAAGSGNTLAFNLTNIAPPQVTVDGPTTDAEGMSVTFTGSFTDINVPTTGPYSYTWHVAATNGQKIPDQSGSISDAGPVPDFTFNPDDDGAYTVSLTITDKFNISGTQSAGMTATNVAPTATISGMSQPNQLFILAGDVLTFSGKFTDPGTADGHTVTWDFGDGNSSSTSFAPSGSESFNINHAFASPGTYTVTLTVTDGDLGGVGSSQMIVVVQAPAGAVGALESYVNTLSNLNKGQQNTLLSTLDSVIDALNKGNNGAAKNKLGSFDNTVNDFLNGGILTQDQATLLLSSADAIKNAIA
jgi:hypothetical protein